MRADYGAALRVLAIRVLAIRAPCSLDTTAATVPLCVERHKAAKLLYEFDLKHRMHQLLIIG